MNKAPSRQNALLIPTLPIELSTNLVSKFWVKVEKGPALNDCWRWTGQKNSDGYPLLWCGIAYNHLRANRLSWVIHNGLLPDGLVVCHSCDNPECTNPAHLFLGDLLDNNADAIVKGRMNCHKHAVRPLPLEEARALLVAAMKEERAERLKRTLTGPKNGTRHAPKLTTSQVREIFALLKEGGKKRGWQSAIARKFGVHPNNISRMYLGKGWVDIGRQCGFNAMGV